jgi:hypothetical protein
MAVNAVVSGLEFARTQAIARRRGKISDGMSG